MNNNKLPILSIFDDIFYLIDEIEKSIKDNDINFNKIITLVDKFEDLVEHIVIEEINEINIHEYNDKLKFAMLAMQDKDFELFNDILVYEIKPLIEYWKQIIVV